ncbi:MAG: TIGR01777 family oxidoreductase [Bacteroidales bacterium]|nr:TIGR01777 family oxidoreductase [Bacteroidales bacterium]
MKKVLITGGTGLVGNNLTNLLVKKGYEVRILSRQFTNKANFSTYRWDYKTGYIDKDALIGIDYIIHLAGENIGAGRWTKKRKKIILDSRVKGSKLIFKTIQEMGIKPKAFISASAVGFYPAFKESEVSFSENDLPGTSFLSDICVKWENAADNFKEIGIRTVKIRTGLVQDKNDAALKKILQTSRFGILPVFGKGQQYFPWIHINDLTQLYIAAIENDKFSNIVNAVAPQQITNYEYIKAIKNVVKQKKIILKIPAFLIKILFGEMSEVLIKGTKVYSKQHENIGFDFRYKNINTALKDILG